MRKQLIKILFFVLLLSIVLSNAVAETQTQYKVSVKNDSKQSGSFCIYQTFPDQENEENFYSLAWFSKATHPDTTVTFEWEQKYSFVWHEPGELTSDMKFCASESKQADPNNVDNNYALFSREGNAYLFNDTVEQGQEGLLTIKADHTIPNNRAFVGVGVGGKTALVVNAFANMSYTFTPKPTYWMIFGNFAEGEVLDSNIMSKAIEIVFDYNIYDQSLGFTESNEWEVLY